MDSWLIAAAGRLLPREWRDWARAMAAELEEVPPAARRRFARGCVSAILRQASHLRIRAWLAQPALLLGVFASGIVIALLDRASDSRGFLWLSLLAGSALAGWYRPMGAWRWGILLALGTPLVSLLDPGGGPYTFDRADAQYGLLPAVAAAGVAAFIRRRVGTVALLLVVIPGLVEAQPRSRLTAIDLAAFADSMFAEYLRHSPEPSLAFVVVNGDSMLFARGFGSEDPAGRRPVDPYATIFWMGSVSKLITADAVLREIERGRLSIDATVRSLLDWPLPAHAGWRGVTVQDLLTHTSGLDEPFMAGNVDRAENLVPLAQYLSKVRWRAGRPPGEVLRYSNHGMALAGLLVERSSEAPFADYVEREIFRPLGMLHSSFRQPIDPELSRRLASAGTDARIDFLLPGPAGAMVATAADMGRFLIAQLDTAGPRAGSLRTMHATRWRGHPGVPGVASGWFETVQGGVEGLFHTGARHHFSVAWIAPRHGVGVFLVHSMRQGGRFQGLRSTVIREFTRRYLAPVAARATSDSSRAVAGVYRPLLLSTTTVERLGYLALDTPVQIEPDGAVTLRAPGELGTVTAQPVGENLFEVHDGPQAGLRIGFLDGEGPTRIALGGTLLDPVVLVKLSWWQRGLVHAVGLGGASLVLTLAGAGYAIRSLRRRRGAAVERNGMKPFVMAAAAGFISALVAFVAVLFTTPEMGAAAHMRAGLHVVLALLTSTWASCIVIPVVTVFRWRHAGIRRSIWVPLSLCAVLVAGLLWHYRLVGFQL